MNDKSIRQFAVSIALIIFAAAKALEDQIPAAVSLFLPVGGVDHSSWAVQAKLAFSAFVGLKIGVYIVLLEQALYRIFGHRFIGKWAYESDSGNFAIASIQPNGLWAGGTTIGYSVSLYRKPEEVLSALNRRGGAVPFGTAHGLMTSFKDGQLTLVYQVDVKGRDYDARRGILTLNATDDPAIVIGSWESTKINDKNVPEKGFREGALTFYTPARFHEKFGPAPSVAQVKLESH